MALVTLCGWGGCRNSEVVGYSRVAHLWTVLECQHSMETELSTYYTCYWRRGRPLSMDWQ